FFYGGYSAISFLASGAIAAWIPAPPTGRRGCLRFFAPPRVPWMRRAGVVRRWRSTDRAARLVCSGEPLPPRQYGPRLLRTPEPPCKTAFVWRVMTDAPRPLPSEWIAL